MLDEELSAALAEKSAQGLERAVRVIPPGVLDLASNDYLGLARHPEVVVAAGEAALLFGGGARAARLVSGHNALHRDLELALAQWKGTPDALVFPSGYAANLAAITALARSGDAVFCDKRNHASLIDGCRLAAQNGARVRYYGSLEKLRALLQSEAGQGSSRTLIVSDAVYSMDGDLCDGPALVKLAREFKAVLLLDDAHGVGTLGRTGRGAMEHWAEADAGFAKAARGIDIVHLGTLSKSLGAQGGFVAASATVTRWLVNAARPFIYTTGLNPAACGAALAALRVLQREPERVARLRIIKAQLTTGLQELGFDAREQLSPVIPVFIGEAADALALSDALREQGVWCPAIRPPTVPAGTSRLRITASAALRDAELYLAFKAFRTVGAH
jgi:8-amino-7-oxononanoate synthase